MPPKGRSAPSGQPSALPWGPRAEGRGQRQPGLAGPGAGASGLAGGCVSPGPTWPHRCPCAETPLSAEAPVLPDPDAPPYDLKALPEIWSPVGRSFCTGLGGGDAARSTARVLWQPENVTQTPPGPLKEGPCPAALGRRRPRRDSGLPVALRTHARWVAAFPAPQPQASTGSASGAGPGGGRARLLAADACSAP